MHCDIFFIENVLVCVNNITWDSLIFEFSKMSNFLYCLACS
uniref:Uncharacterized protein n=1 Tax=Rhizophora mucronata TaxID=61149 RepID=A0A2P2PU83_RHIMU